MNNLNTFNFESNPVRVVMGEDGKPWWVLRDVCEALGLASPHKVAERLDGDERNQIPVIDAMGRSQDTTTVNESGLYSVILRSDKPEAKRFKKWITSEVLPSIRQTGSYKDPGFRVPKTFAEALSLAAGIIVGSRFVGVAA